MKRKSSGFTLIELLVVIAIIALLAAILFPVFARARENARRSSCQSNLKQIGISMIQYTQDYDESLPSIFYGGTNGTRWFQVINPYLKSSQVLLCPSDVKNPADNVSYAINCVSMKKGTPTPPAGLYSDADIVPLANADYPNYNYSVKVSEVNDAAGTVWVMDKTTWSQTYSSAFMSVLGTDYSPNMILIPLASSGPGDPQYDYWVNGENPTHGAAIVNRHLSTCNFLYTDGHVKSGKLEQILTNPARTSVESD